MIDNEDTIWSECGIRQLHNSTRSHRLLICNLEVEDGDVIVTSCKDATLGGWRSPRDLKLNHQNQVNALLSLLYSHEHKHPQTSKVSELITFETLHMLMVARGYVTVILSHLFSP